MNGETRARTALIRVLKEFGGLNPKVFLTLIFGLILFELFVETVSRLVDEGSVAAAWAQVEASRMVWLRLAGFPLLVLVLWLGARHMAGRLRISVDEDLQPLPGRALILFLSSRGKDPVRVEGDIREAGTRAGFGRSSWRMPAEAIAYHHGHGWLRHVVVIPSCDTEKRPGTWREVDEFRATITPLLWDRAPAPEIVTLAELTGAPGDAEGVHFELAGPLVDALHRCYGALAARNVRGRDVVVDITGGQKPATVAGAVIALNEGRRFQYVSMHDYRVRGYDLTYDATD